MASERRWVVLAVAVAALLSGCRSEPQGTYRGPEAVVPPTVDEVAKPAPPASQDERMAWWREARFGMFILWAVNYIIRWTAQFPAYPRLLFGFCREGLTGRLGVVDSSANAYRGLKIIFNLS